MGRRIGERKREWRVRKERRKRRKKEKVKGKKDRRMVNIILVRIKTFHLEMREGGRRGGEKREEKERLCFVPVVLLPQP